MVADNVSITVLGLALSVNINNSQFEVIRLSDSTAYRSWLQANEGLPSWTNIVAVSDLDQSEGPILIVRNVASNKTLVYCTNLDIDMVPEWLAQIEYSLAQWGLGQ